MMGAYQGESNGTGHTLYDRRVWEFRRSLIVGALAEHRGNRTHAARALGLQRTYLQRLIRQFKVAATVPRIEGEGEPNGT